MARILLLFVFVVAVNGRHIKIPKVLEGDRKNVVCNSTHERLRNDYMKNSSCGEPKEVFLDLKITGAHLQVTPRSVWVKRCVGLCDFGAPGSQCVPSETRIEPIPVRIYDLKKNKESCSTYNMEVHVSCQCCAVREGDCAAPKVYNARKCTCQCPNAQERRNCLKKRNSHMRWNRSKCACEKRRTLW